jgi:hypothetical protein
LNRYHIIALLLHITNNQSATCRWMANQARELVKAQKSLAEQGGSGIFDYLGLPASDDGLLI